MRVLLNGKFLRAESTGVHRVAAELSNALVGLAIDGHPCVENLSFELVIPSDGKMRAKALAMPTRVLGPMTGIPWEQLTLPLSKGKSLLLNLCNIGPMLSRNAVTMIHDVQVHLTPDSYSRGFRLWYRLVQPIFARRHRLILTVSEFSRHQIARVGLAPLERIVVIHNGVDHLNRVVSDHALNDRLKLTPHRYVLSFANTQSHKNIGVLLKAFESADLINVPLVLVGTSDAAAFKAAGLAVPGNTVFAGRATDGELRALMENAACLAFPSTTEGFGLPPLEAMTLGCAAVVAPCGALPEVCGDAAIYADPDDVDAWAAAISALLQNDEHRARRAFIGIEHARRFTWRNAAIRLAETLNTLGPLSEGN